MLHTNLSTRPFYNLRTVRVVLGIAAAIVIALVLFDIVRILKLSVSQRSLGASATEAEAQAVRLLAEADRTRKQTDPVELQTVASAAREANVIIDRRAFSWTELFERFEATLPADVRITAVQPNVLTDGTVRIGVVVQARRAEDLDAFVEALEASGAFRGALTTQEATDGEGLLTASVEATYAAAIAGAPPAGDEVSNAGAAR